MTGLTASTALILGAVGLALGIASLAFPVVIISAVAVLGLIATIAAVAIDCRKVNKFNQARENLNKVETAHQSNNWNNIGDIIQIGDDTYEVIQR